MNKISTTLLALAASYVGIATVYAFPFNRSWHESSTGVAGTNRAGGGGIYGTGGRSDHGIKCSDCHIGGEGIIDFTVTTVPAFATIQGEDSYSPGQKYKVTVRLIGEHRGLAANSNKNSMALTIENASGLPTGRFESDSGQDSNNCPTNNPFPNPNSQPAGRTTMLYGDCHGVLPLQYDDLTAWTFDWTAPSAGGGDLTIFAGVVDGDTGGESSLDDDTKERAIPLREGS